MKRFKRFFNKITIGVLSVSILFSSCDLDVTPPDTMAGETFWNSASDASSFLTTIYRKSQLTPSSAIYGDTYSDDVYCQYPWESAGSIFQQDGLSDSEDAPPYWNFELIRKVNIFLANVDRCVMEDDLKERFKAEARCLRAMDYLNKAIGFGKVPVITEPLEYQEKNIPRNPVNEVYEFIIDELTDVAKVLPAGYESGSDKGRVTKYSAMALKARAALYSGNYSVAESVCKEIMNSGQFSLFKITSLNDVQKKEADEMDQYIDFDLLGIDKDKFMMGMFSYESIWHDQYAKADNPEYILTRPYAAVSGYGDGTRYTNMRPDQLGGGWSSVTPTQNLVDAYWTADGKEPAVPSVAARKTAYKIIGDEFSTSQKSVYQFVAEKLEDGSLKKYEYVKEFRNRDPRLYASIMFPFKTWYETEIGDFAYEWKPTGNNESKTGFNFRKMVALDRASYGSGHSTSDWPTIRYAEVLLMFAEARTNNVGFDGEVQGALNQIRDRCGMPNVPSSLSKEEGLSLIQRERRVELAAEGLRNKDVSRYSEQYWKNHMGNVILCGPNAEPIHTFQWSSRMRLKPINQDAIKFNPILKDDQNPGY